MTLYHPVCGESKLKFALYSEKEKSVKDLYLKHIESTKDIKTDTIEVKP